MNKKQYEMQLKKCNKAIQNLSEELQRLSEMASNILGYNVVAMCCSDAEIELRPSTDGYNAEIEDIPMRPEDVLENIK